MWIQTWLLGLALQVRGPFRYDNKVTTTLEFGEKISGEERWGVWVRWNGMSTLPRVGHAFERGDRIMTPQKSRTVSPSPPSPSHSPPTRTTAL